MHSEPTELPSNRLQFRVQVLTETVLSKPVFKLTIGAQGSKKGSARLQVVVFAGLGANCQSAASFVCQGLVDFALSDHPVAQTLRAQAHLVVFPMLDPDSIWVGNARSDLFGQTQASERLLRQNPRLYRNFSSFSEQVNEICSSESKVVILKLGVNSKLIGSRIVGVNFEQTFRMERHLLLPRLFTRFIDGFYLEKCSFVDHMKQDTDCNLFDEFHL